MAEMLPPELLSDIDGFDPTESQDQKPPELEPLDHDQVAAILQQEIADSVNHYNSEIADSQAESLRYYFGRPFGNEMKGRSKVVLTDVRDTIEWIMPTMMRAFFGARKVVRYVPQGPEDEEWAEQATDYAQFLMRRGNSGFTVMNDWFKDALIEKLGAVVVFYEEKEQRELERYEQLSEQEMQILLQEEGVELVAYEESVKQDVQVDPQTGQPVPIEISEFEVHIRRVKKRGQIKIEGIPQEEFLVARRCRTVDDDCPFVGRRRKVTFSDMVAAGFTPSFVETLCESTGPNTQPGALERRDDEGGYGQDIDSTYDRADWASREIWLTECWIRIDEDGDGYSELRRILAAGETGITILEDDEVTHIPISTLCPVPIPHKLYGLSWADLIKDLQLIRSMLLRNMFDNIYQQNNQKTAVVEGEVEVDDLLSTTPGGYVRMSAPGMLEPIVTQQLGPMAMAMLEYMHGVKEDRTGITRYTQGSDAANLNQTATGITSIIEQANIRIEMLVRIFGETGVTRLFEQILHVMRESPVKEEVVRIRDQWVPMDPRMWRANLDVEVEVGLGTSQSAIRVDNMMMLWDLQQQVAEKDPRMVTPKNLFATVERIPEAMGFPTKGLFFTEPNFAEPAPETDPDPKLVEADAKQKDVQAKITLERETLEFRRNQAALEAQLKREQIEAQIKIAEIQAQGTIAQAAIHADTREKEAKKRRWLGAGRKD
jgi:hypothetical protein